MAEYIERNAAVALLRKRGLNSAETIDTVFANGILDSARFLQEIPSSNVAPVVHGHWKRNHQCQLYCSRCLEYQDPAIEKPYCSNCGAKMDMEAADGD